MSTYSNRLAARLDIKGVPGFGTTKPPGWVFDRIAEEKASGADKTGSRKVRGVQEHQGRPWKTGYCNSCGVQLPTSLICDEHGIQQKKPDQRIVGRRKDAWL